MSLCLLAGEQSERVRDESVREVEEWQRKVLLYIAIVDLPM